MANTLLEVQGLKVAYGGIQAVKGVSFDVPENSTVALVGESGSGKSVTLRTLLRLHSPRRTITVANGA
mgnify:CR=1 FL=1